MKRWICIFMVCAMLCALLPAAAFAITPETDTPETTTHEPILPETDDPVIDEAAIAQGLAYAQEHPELVHELSAPEEVSSTSPAVRGSAEDNLVMPAPLMEGLAAKKGDDMTLPLIRIQTGKTGQMQAVMIYKGKNPTGNPVEILLGNFTEKVGMFETTGTWDTSKAAYGTYTVVSCTAVPSGDNFYVVDNTAFAEYVYVVDYHSYIESYYFVDENGNRLDKICSDGTDLSYAIVKHEPAIVTQCGEVDVSCYGVADVEEYHGLIVVAPKTYGWSELTVTKRTGNYDIFFLDIEVCVHPDGHRPQQTLLRSPSRNSSGGTMYYCPDCCTSKIVESNSYSTIFAVLGDVPEDAWYYSSVQEAVCRGLFNGVSAHRFRPDYTMTRAMLVTVLWRYAGSPKEGTNTFTDVKAGQWYTDAVAWAAKNKVVDGVGNQRFAPDDTITREQMAAILYRYATYAGFDTSARTELSTFADNAGISAWAAEAMQWCVAEGFIGGMTQGGSLILDPQGSATRAQVAAILVRFIQKFDPSEQVGIIDPTGAADSGDYRGLQWAYYPDGTLVFAGKNARIPDTRDQYGAVHPDYYPMPWDDYKDEVKTVKILNGVNYIGIEAFRNCKNLESVEMADSVTIIAAGAFRDCSALTEIQWPQKDLSIALSAFQDCTALKEVTLPDSLYHMGASIFKGCTSLEKVALPDTLFTQSFYGGAYSIGGELFAGCTALTQVRLPLGMTNLPTGFFRDCTSLENVEFPKGMSYIASEAFDGCESLKTLVLPENIYSICDEAFRRRDSVDRCGLTDLYILNPMLTVISYKTASDGSKVWDAPFGNPEKVTVHAYTGTEVEWLAKKMGYKFVPLEE